MDAITFKIYGNWGHFKKVDTNNNPLTHDFIPKTALIGLIGAVNGIERSEMKKLFPQLSEDLLYSVALNNHVRKESWGFTLRSVKVNLEKSPWQFEFLKHPNFTIVLGLGNARSRNVFNEFCDNVKNSNACFQPTLGLANCDAEIEFVDSGKLSDIKIGAFKTQGFISKKHEIEIDETFDFRIGFDKIPTFQNNDFWNDPEKYAELAYCSGGNMLQIKKGEYYEMQTSKQISQWYMI